MGIRFGWRIPEFSVKGSRGQEFVSEIIRSLEVVEQRFESAWLSDHVIPWADWQSPASDNLEGWTTINYLMGMFRHLSFGHIVLCNSFRNPALLAKMGATLSTLAPGRFILGIGAGWKKDEYLSYGYDFPAAPARIHALEEAVQIVRLMWKQDLVHFSGKHFKIHGAYCNPKPITPPPILIGGGGEKLTLRVVASQADWWNSGRPLQEYRHKLDVLKNHCEKIGRDYGSITKTWVGAVAIAEKQDEALRMSKNNPFTRNETAIVGTPEQVTQQLAEFAEIGVEYFILRFLDFPSLKGTEQFAEKVAAEFR